MLCLLAALLTTCKAPLHAQQTPASLPPALQLAAEISAGKKALATKQYVQAKVFFSTALKDHPESLPAKLGVADSELGLDHYEAAESMYREIVAVQPELWQAHKNLIVVEAALGRWEDFDNERTVLRLARERGAPGISARESDVIDSFVLNGNRWVVRQYFEPVGRSQTRYNFEHFSADGKAAEYISLDGAGVSAPAPAGSIIIGAAPVSPQTAPTNFSLNWFTGKAHGTIRSYGTREPSYEVVRTDVRRWLRQPKR
jgi:tetratricopeptide (TPR) repeat protein